MLNISVDDLETMYLDTVCSLGDQLVLIKGINPDKAFWYWDKDSKEHLIYFDKEEDLPKAPKLPYYLNVENKYCVRIIRKPSRRSRQGACADNTSISKVGLANRLTIFGDMVYYDAMNALLQQAPYPSFKDAITLLNKGPTTSVAIDRQICLTGEGSVIYKGEIIGEWDSNGFALTESGLNVKRYNKCLL
jgi:hypothetical protein